MPLLKVLLPATRAALAARLALVSLELSATVSVTVLTRFQLASTALTVTSKALPAVRALGLPLLPLAVPGAAVSPGRRSWSLVKAPALTLMLGLVFAVLLPSLLSLAVRV